MSTVSAIALPAFALAVRRRRQRARADLSSRFDLSRHGFLAAPCAQRLPSSHGAWERISRALPRLNAHGELSAAVQALPNLTIPDVGWNSAQYKRAYILLGQVVHSLVNGHKARWKPKRSPGGDDSDSNAPQAAQEDHAPLCRIPATIAVPFDQVCTRLGLPRVLTAALDLWNWRLLEAAEMDGDSSGSAGLDPSASAHAAATARQERPLPLDLEKLTCISTMTGTKAEVYFHMVVTAMHAVAAEKQLLQRIIEAPQWVHVAAAGIDERDSGASGEAHALAAPACAVESACDALACVLLDIGAALGTFRDIFRRVHDLVSMDIFYFVYRPLLGGWWPEGVLFEGVRATPPAPNGSGVLSTDTVSDDGWRIFRCKGPSAGQSTMILLFDMLLGVDHSRAMAAFQEEVLQYLPAPHRDCVVDLGRRLRDAARVLDGGVAKSALAPAAEALEAPPAVFSLLCRRLWQAGHFSAADRLLRAHTECACKLKALRQYHIGVATKYLVRTKKGTGSSTFRSLLNDAIEGTRDAALCPMASAEMAEAAGNCPLSS